MEDTHFAWQLPLEPKKKNHEITQNEINYKKKIVKSPGKGTLLDGGGGGGGRFNFLFISSALQKNVLIN